eukprot:COSAG01_NODE_65580_length_273_cov_0.425287_1_plen_81_part_10
MSVRVDLGGRRIIKKVQAAPKVAAGEIRGSRDDIVGAGSGCHPQCGATALSVSGWAVDPQLDGGRTPVNVSLLFFKQKTAY